jgi:hypothetical protein
MQSSISSSAPGAGRRAPEPVAAPHVFSTKPEEAIMGLATYAIIETGKIEIAGPEIRSTWGVLHDGDVEGTFATKESAFEAAVAAASLAVREGHEVHVTVPSREAGNRTALGGASN